MRYNIRDPATPLRLYTQIHGISATELRNTSHMDSKTFHITCSPLVGVQWACAAATPTRLRTLSSTHPCATAQPNRPTLQCAKENPNPSCCKGKITHLNTCILPGKNSRKSCGNKILLSRQT